MIKLAKRESNFADPQSRRTAYLILGFVEDTLSKPEHDELDEWVSASNENLLLFEKMTDPVFLAGLNRQKSAIRAFQNLQRRDTSVLFKPKPGDLHNELHFFYIVAVAGFLVMMAGIFVLIR